MADETSFTANISGVQDLVENDVNKVGASAGLSNEGVAGEKKDVLDLPMNDAELLALKNEWEATYAPYEGKIKPIFKRNLRSYLGRDPGAQILDTELPGAANLQFEAEETFLPAALARNPDPLVYSDNSPEGNAIADSVKTMLQFHADQLLLKRKLAVMVRQWSIYHLGVLKAGWNPLINDVALENRKIQDFIFDPNGFVDVYGDFSSYLGERIKVTAEKLCKMFPKHEAYIKTTVESRMGTEVVYTEWWTDEYCFTTYKDEVLDKHKNEYYNYPQEPVTDELTGVLIPIPRKVNHFAAPKKPYIFLSVFSLQERPHDITGLIEQNIPNQAKIFKRTEQIDENISQSNNGLAFSENNFNQETAKQAANALTRGVGKVLVPAGGPISEAIVRIQPGNLPNDAFEDLENSENHLRSSWGVQGISAESPEANKNTTARGMVLNQGRDTSRIGGGISDTLEQSVARSTYNWLVQLYCVFYDEPHFAAVLGIGKATEYVTLSAQNIDRQLIVSVAPNSMKPKDEVTTMNQAQVLFEAKAIGPKTLLEAMNFPNADEAAADGILYALDPMTYVRVNFPELFQQLQQVQQEQQAAAQAAQQQEMAVGKATAEQGLNQKEQEHKQKLRQGEEAHQQKVAQSQDMASAKLANVQLPK
jgi:hypothetical protein